MSIEVQDIDFLEDVLSSGRARGLYDGQFKEFGEAEVAGGKVDLTEGVFKGRKPATVKTGFESAKQRLLKLADHPAWVKEVEIRATNGQVYLIRKDLLAASKS